MANEDKITEEIQQLVWALVDDQIGPEQLARLEELLGNDPVARRIYIDCVQMHADLHMFFSSEDKQEEGSSSTPPLRHVPLLSDVLDNLPQPGPNMPFGGQAPMV